MSSKDENKGWIASRKNDSDGQYDITYSIVASAFGEQKLLTSTSRTINVVPVSQAQPPLSPSDFPGEYFFAAKSPHQSKAYLTKTSSPRIEVAGQEPAPLLLDAHNIQTSASTEVFFVVKALPSQVTDRLDALSLPTQCQLKAELVTKTLVTPDRRSDKAMPTLEQAKYGDDSYLRVSKSNSQQFTVAIPRWEFCALSRSHLPS